MRRRLILVTLLMMLSSGPAFAEWAKVGSNEEGETTAYADLETIQWKGNIVNWWELIDHTTARPMTGGSFFLSMKAHREYDCSAELHRTLNEIFYSGNMGSGEVGSTNSKVRRWEGVPPGESVAQALWKRACAKP